MVVRKNSAFLASLMAFSITGGLVAAPLMTNASPAQAQGTKQDKNTDQAFAEGLFQALIYDVKDLTDTTINFVTLDNLLIVDAKALLKMPAIKYLESRIGVNEAASANQALLTTLLRDAGLIKTNEVVVGISGRVVFVK